MTILNNIDEQIRNIFGLQPNEVKIGDNFKYAQFCYNVSNFEIPISETLKIFSSFPNRDDYSLEVVVNSTEPITLNKSVMCDTFLKELEEIKGFIDLDSKISITLNIYKNIEFNILSIYNLEQFTKYLNDLTVSDLINQFSSLLNSDLIVQFQVLEKEYNLKTSTIFFTNDPIKNNHFGSNRNPIIKNKIGACHSINFPDNIVPSDFEIITETGNGTLVIIFNKLKLLTSVVYIFDFTEIKNNSLHYRLHSYTTIEGDINFDELSASTAFEYYKIYEWLYSQSNYHEKIDLTRNLISLHFENNNPFKLKGNPLSAFKSNYKIYLKENVKRYIEVKNKVSEFIYDLSQRATKVIDSFIDSFKKNLFALFSFYISVIIIKILSNNDTVHIFNSDTAFLSLGFLIISLIFLFFSIWELNNNKERFEANYRNLKNRYKDLLVEEDIKTIFNNDDDFEFEVINIKKKRIRYIIMWILALIILSLITIYLWKFN